LVSLSNRPPKNLLLLTRIAHDMFLGGTSLFQSTTHPSWCTDGDECYDELEHVYGLQAMSTYTHSLRVGGKLFLRARLMIVIEWHVHHILDAVVNCCSP